jgi:hypothetical protein
MIEDNGKVISVTFTVTVVLGTWRLRVLLGFLFDSRVAFV